MQLKIELLTKADMDKVVSLQRETAYSPLSYNEIVKYTKQKNTTALVAKEDRGVVGFMLYESTKKARYIVTLCVDPMLRRQGIGSKLMQNMLDKIKEKKIIYISVHEEEFSAQMFLKKFGFIAKVNGTDRSIYDFTREVEPNANAIAA